MSPRGSMSDPPTSATHHLLRICSFGVWIYTVRVCFQRGTTGVSQQHSCLVTLKFLRTCVLYLLSYTSTSPPTPPTGVPDLSSQALIRTLYLHPPPSILTVTGATLRAAGLPFLASSSLAERREVWLSPRVEAATGICCSFQSETQVAWQTLSHRL